MSLLPQDRRLADSSPSEQEEGIGRARVRPLPRPSLPHLVTCSRPVGLPVPTSLYFLFR